MVTARLSLPDAQEKGWLLDGYPRSYAQAQSLEERKIRPDIYIVLEVPDEILIDRCVGRRLDPLTGKIYHIKNFPPETEEIKARLVTRPDDTEEKVKSRLEIYKQNAQAILSTYLSVMNKIDGNRPKDVVFGEVDSLLSRVQKDKAKTTKLGNPVSGISLPSNQATKKEGKWRGIPTRLNNIPHSREIRTYFYDDVLQATQRAIYDGKTRLKVEINIPELNPEMDVYRIGTLTELVRVIALSFADDGKRVKVCVQGSMGEGALAGMPLQLAGTRKILEFMDWGDDGALGTFIQIGSIGAKEVDEQDDIFILVAPQNAVGNCIIDDLRGMTESAGMRPVILINPRLKVCPKISVEPWDGTRDWSMRHHLRIAISSGFSIMQELNTQLWVLSGCPTHTLTNCTNESISHLGRRSISCFQHSMEDQVLMKSTMPSLGNQEIKSRAHPEYGVS
ncbi:hypothetical protein ACJRO7_013503 [Eucalyptus globulus]|uniref:adenylate kinase n=1 Tax=Eucalyptus globulus TaxID=34317 RepID=A0ABD3KX32_EUCGL